MTTTVTLAAVGVITTTPIVFTVVFDALESGIVPSLDHPGGNITRATSSALEAAGKCLEPLREAVPGSSRVAVLWEPSNPGVKRSFEEVRKVAAGLGLTASFTDNFTRAAVYVDKILRGVSPEDLPVEQPTTFELAINLKTAEALGLTIPPSLLLRAEQVADPVSD